MFKDSSVTKLDAWSTTEEADAIPALCYPAFVGTGKLGVGLDAAGLQSLPDVLGEHYNSPVKPFHITQADLYVLREGMISAHLWDDEILYTGCKPPAEHARRESQRNFMPLGYLTHTFEYDGEGMNGLDWIPQRVRIEGGDVRRHACYWRRDWDLRSGVVRTSYDLGMRQRFRVAMEAFAPHGGESVYLKLTRGAMAGGSGACAWSVSLQLATRHGIALFDQPGAVQPGRRTILARIDRASAHTPAEPYAVVYGAAAAGMDIVASSDGWTATLRGDLREDQTAWLRLDFRRHAGDEIARAPACRDTLEAELAAFTREAWEQASRKNLADYAAFWAQTADIAVEPADAFETRRRFLLHRSEHLVHCGNDHAMGGTAQFLINHQNGWRACNFHDHHYIMDGAARTNLWREAESHAHWLRQIMHAGGRPFPWMMTYDGFATVPAEIDRAPMSDANRALLAMRVYELAGTGRERLLRETVYPIVRAVAEHGAADWFYEQDGRMLFRAVENDVMHDVARISESGTLMMYVTVLRKAIAYSEQLGIDPQRCAAWRRIVEAVRFDRTPNGCYRAWFGAPDDARGNTFFVNAAYIAEGHEYMDRATFRHTRDFGERVVSCNFPWINSAAVSSEIRLGRPDRAEQFMVDSLENGVHGPGYFEECTPTGLAALPPFATAHGSYLTACCEQVVLPDFWHPRVYIGCGLPSRLRNTRVSFANLRALAGLLVSGTSEPRRLAVDLHHTGDAVELEIVLRVPCAVGVHFEALRDGQPVEHVFAGDTVTVRQPLVTGQRANLEVRG